MIRFVIVCSLGPLFAANAHAGFFTNNKTNTNTAKPSPSSFTRTTMPLWKQRLYDRFQNQWDRPGGVNFPKPAVEATVINTTASKAQGEGTFWSRVTKAWRAVRNWNNGKISSETQSPLENQAGFGGNVRRADSHVNTAWHWRTARPKPFTPPVRPHKPPKRFKPRTWD